jgi:putative tricarboxylic transport membrane protein
LGIPGGNAAAVMMSALVLKGVQLGPLLLVNQPDYLSGTFISMIITNIVMVVVAILIAKVFAQILAIPYSFLGPIIIMLAVIGSYATNMNIFDVKIMAIAGIAGMLFKVLKFNSAALILGLVLGSICEGNFSRAYTISRGSLWTMFNRPVAGIIMLVCILALIYPMVAPFIKKRLKSGGNGKK